MLKALLRWWERRRRAAFDRRSGKTAHYKAMAKIGVYLEPEIDLLTTLWRVGDDIIEEKSVVTKDFELRGWPPVRRVPRYPRPPAPPEDHPAFRVWQKVYGSAEEWAKKYDSDRS